LRATDLQKHADGDLVRIAGLAIVKQRPGTANGFVFMSITDETGIFNVIITKEFFERNRLTVSRCKFVSVEGPLQKQDGIIHVKAARMAPLPSRGLEVRSHDFN
jgi:error-prone DNA polymerase